MSKVLSGEEVAADREAAQKTTDEAAEAAGSNQLSIVVANSGLEPTKAQVILTKFGDSADILADWEERSKAIVVTDASQTGVMQMARAGRLALKAMRTEVERTRVEMKAEIVTQGKAIDGIANFLKGAIVPIEKHLSDQEHFVERQEEIAAVARRQAAEEALQEKEEREAAAEKTRLAEQAAENEQLRKENEVKDLALEAERKDAADKLAAQQKANDAKVARERKKAAADAKAAADKAAEVAKQEAEKKAKEDAKVAAAKAKADREKAAAAAKVVAERNRVEIERVAKENAEREAAHKEAMRQARMVTCPHCGETFENAPKEQKI